MMGSPFGATIGILSNLIFGDSIIYMVLILSIILNKKIFYTLPLLRLKVLASIDCIEFID